MAGGEERRAREAVIGRLRVRGGGCEPLSARLRLEGLLGSLDFTPGGPPPSAIVCIHRMEDPRPRTLRLHRYELRPPAEWEQAFRESLRERLARAARPVRGELSGEALAVVFADPAELYACLASDVGSGQAASRWWWASLFRGADPYRALVAEWARAPEYVPASLELVARWGRAEAFLRRLGEAEARELLAKVNRRFGLRALEDALAWGGAVLPVESPGESRSGAGVQEAPGAGAGEPPWRRWAPEVDSAVLGLEPATLLGVALMIRRAPRVIDLPGTASEVAGWRERMRQSLESRPTPPSPRRPRDSGQEEPVGPAAPAWRRKTGPSSEEPTDSASPETVSPKQRPRMQWEWSSVEHAPNVPGATRPGAPFPATGEDHCEREHGAPGASSTAPASAAAPVMPSTEEALVSPPPAAANTRAAHAPTPPAPPHHDPARAHAWTPTPSSASTEAPSSGLQPLPSLSAALPTPLESAPSSDGRPSPSVSTGPDSAPGTVGSRPPLHSSPPHAGSQPRTSFNEALAPPPASPSPSDERPSPSVSTGPGSAPGTVGPLPPLHSSPPHAGSQPRTSFNEALAPSPASPSPSDGKPSPSVSTGPDSVPGPVGPHPPLHSSPPHAGSQPHASSNEALDPPPASPSPSDATPSPSVSTGPGSVPGPVGPRPLLHSSPPHAGSQPRPSFNETLAPPLASPSPSDERPLPSVSTGPGSAPGTAGPRPPLHSSRREDAEPFSWTGAPIHTRLGGVFYLLNLGLALELYGDFTQPAFPGLRLPVWDFLSLLGRELLVEPAPDDPLWTLLERLAGRPPGTPPGDGFEPPTEWRTPPAWLKSFREPGTCTWTAPPPGTPGRLLVRHPAGFLVLDVPRTPEEPEAQLQRETSALASLATFTRASDTPAGGVTPDAPLERWLGWLVPYVRAWLARALGTDGPAELSRVLLEHQARVHVTESHVDVVFSLEALPLPIRFAGLDRDIGWIPAAGRHVLFHFE